MSISADIESVDGKGAYVRVQEDVLAASGQSVDTTVEGGQVTVVFEGLDQDRDYLVWGYVDLDVNGTCRYHQDVPFGPHRVRTGRDHHLGAFRKVSLPYQGTELGEPSYPNGCWGYGGSAAYLQVSNLDTAPVRSINRNIYIALVRTEDDFVLDAFGDLVTGSVITTEAVGSLLPGVEARFDVFVDSDEDGACSGADGVFLRTQPFIAPGPDRIVGTTISAAWQDLAACDTFALIDPARLRDARGFGGD